MTSATLLAKRKRGRIGDDGVPYEKLGPGIRQIVTEIQDLRERATWYPASPYVVVYLRQIIERLYAVSGTDGTVFLANIGLESLGDLDELRNMSAASILELMTAAMSSLPHEIMVEIGLEETA